MIVSQVRRTIEARGLFRRGDRVVVACSGGPDSVAMTHALSRLAEPLGLFLTVAVVDHGLREGVDREIALVAALAERLALPFRGLRVDVQKVQKIHGGTSLQGAARDARYRALLGLAAELEGRRIAVAHTLDDQAETVLDRLLRGASVAGLAGIAPRRRDGVVRPLIDVRRADVLRHLAHHDLTAAEDPSNRDTRFTRVRIRERLLPMLADEDPNVARHLAQLADDARAARQLIRRAGGRLLERSRREMGLDREILRAGREAARRDAIRRFLRESGTTDPRRAHLVGVDALISGGMGEDAEVRLGQSRVARVRDGMLVVHEEVLQRPGRPGSRSPNH